MTQLGWSPWYRKCLRNLWWFLECFEETKVGGMWKTKANLKILDLKMAENKNFKWIISRQRPEIPPSEGAPQPVSGLTGLCVHPFLSFFLHSQFTSFSQNFNRSAPLKVAKTTTQKEANNNLYRALGVPMEWDGLQGWNVSAFLLKGKRKIRKRTRHDKAMTPY